jgi:hypothetical protein
MSQESEHISQHQQRHGIKACRQRLRRGRVVTKMVDCDSEGAQAANRESLSNASEIDLHGLGHARFEVENEADGA